MVFRSLLLQYECSVENAIEPHVLASCSRDFGLLSRSPPTPLKPPLKKNPHPIPSHSSSSLDGPAAQALQRRDLQAACYWMGPCYLATPRGPRPASHPPISLAHNNFHPPSPLMGDPFPALSDRFYPFSCYRLDPPPPDGRGGAGALAVWADAGFPYRAQSIKFKFF